MGAGASVNSPRGGSGALERLPEAQDVPGLVASYMQSCVERHHLRLSAPSSSGSSSMDRSSSKSALTPPTLGSGKRSLTPLQSLKSLKSMALKSYSRQENTYIPHEAILSASQTHLSRLRSHNALSARPLATVGSSTGSLLSAGSGSGGGGAGTGGGSHPGSKPGSFRKTPPGSQAALGTAGDASSSPAPGVPSVGAAAGTNGSKKGGVGTGTGGGGGGGGMQAARPNLRINVNVNIQDDVDWIHVSDDEGEEEQAPKVISNSQLLLLIPETHPLIASQPAAPRRPRARRCRSTPRPHSSSSHICSRSRAQYSSRVRLASFFASCFFFLFAFLAPLFRFFFWCCVHVGCLIKWHFL